MAIKIIKEANKNVDVNLSLRNRIYTVSFLTKEKGIM